MYCTVGIDKVGFTGVCFFVLFFSNEVHMRKSVGNLFIVVLCLLFFSYHLLCNTNEHPCVREGTRGGRGCQ